MTRQATPRRPMILAWIVAATASPSIAHADGIVTYSVTNLGAGDPEGFGQPAPGSVSFGTDASGQRTVINAAGTAAYAFPEATTALTPDAAAGLAGLPQVGPDAWNVNGHLASKSSDLFSNSFIPQYMTSQGLLVGIDRLDYWNHTEANNAYALQRQPDGTWANLGEVAVGRPGGDDLDPGDAGVRLAGLSNNGRLLEYNIFDPQWLRHTVSLHDLKSGSTLDISNLVQQLPLSTFIKPPNSTDPSPNTDYLSAQVDRDGRVLVSVELSGQSASGASQGYFNTLLLTPNDVSSDPTTVPGPSSWLTAIALVAGFAVHRARRRA